MATHVAFLRGINVGGRKTMPMAAVIRVFESINLKDVETYIQSGNVLFATRATDLQRLRSRIEKELREQLGPKITIVLRPLSALATIVDRDPFRNLKLGAEAKPYVTFLAWEPAEKPELPLRSRTSGVEVVEVVGGDVFSLSRKKKGRFGFPNAFVEKEFGIQATTRNWTTVRKVTVLGCKGQT